MQYIDIHVLINIVKMVQISPHKPCMYIFDGHDNKCNALTKCPEEGILTPSLYDMGIILKLIKIPTHL